MTDGAVPKRKRTAVLISGRGTNLQALIDHGARDGAAAEVVLVLSNRSDAAGLARAARAGIATVVVDHRRFASRQAFEKAIANNLDGAGIEMVCLAGFMRILSPWLVSHYRNRMLNIHPSLLPAFRGLDTHRRALDAGVRIHGCTVHLVRDELDAGPILVQAALRIRPDDTEDTLAMRVLKLEHRAFPLALELLASSRFRIDGDRIEVGNDDWPRLSFFSDD